MDGLTGGSLVSCPPGTIRSASLRQAPLYSPSSAPLIFNWQARDVGCSQRHQSSQCAVLLALEVTQVTHHTPQWQIRIEQKVGTSYPLYPVHSTVLTLRSRAGVFGVAQTAWPACVHDPDPKYQLACMLLALYCPLLPALHALHALQFSLYGLSVWPVHP
jgi:hypothetical protein